MKTTFVITLLLVTAHTLANPFDTEVANRQKIIARHAQDLSWLNTLLKKDEQQLQDLLKIRQKLLDEIATERKKIKEHNQQIAQYQQAIKKSEPKMQQLIGEITRLNAQISSYNDFFGIDDKPLRDARLEHQKKLTEYEENLQRLEEHIASRLQSSTNERLIGTLISEKQTELKELDRKIAPLRETIAKRTSQRNEIHKKHQSAQESLAGYISDHQRNISPQAKEQEARRKQEQMRNERLAKEKENTKAVKKGGARPSQISQSQTSSPKVIMSLLKKAKIRPLVANYSYDHPVRGTVINRSIGINSAVRYSVKQRMPVRAISDGVLFYRSSDELGTRSRVLAIAHDNDNIGVYQDLLLDDGIVLSNHQIIKKGQVIGYTNANEMNFYIYRPFEKVIPAYKFLKR